MEVTLEEWYAPNINSVGVYVDHVPLNTVKCPCGNKKYTKQSFSSHTKTQRHEKWLATLNANKANYYVENEKLKDIVKTQQLLLTRLENEVRMKQFIIDDIKQKHVQTINLLD
jgi:hypothetical protein